jgi:hypothetical protein
MKLDVRNNRLSFGGRGIGGTTRQDRVVAEARTQAGVALVITLILLSVITFMVVTFLVIGFNQRGATTTQTDFTIAAGAADTAKEAALAQAMSMILGFTNANNYDILVSTNYVSSGGYISGNRSLTNVSYNYPNGNPLTGNDALENLSHLLYFPRVPVYITNRLTGGMEFRYYVDLNRNGRYDPNGYLPVISPFPAAPYYTTNGVPQPTPLFGNTLSNLFIGDPEWVAIFDRPGYMPALDVNASSFPVGYPHSPTNRAVARYAFVVVPAGKALDINYMHNYARKLQQNMAGADGFLRNEGVGSWEMNLASFFYDLNTNIWPMKEPNFYGYPPYLYNLANPIAAGNQGVAFDDSLSIVRYRYNTNYANLDTVENRYGLTVGNLFKRDFIDAYLNPGGSLHTSVQRPVTDFDAPNKPWDGSENFKHFVDMQELFDTGKVTGFGGNTLSNRLWMAGTNQSSYDRYTFYRLLSQLGTDSAIDTRRMNLNYDNLVQANNITGVKSVTNFFDWKPIDFFTNAANRLFASAGLNFDATRIQIWPTNYYTPSVHRLLQLAANIYDATSDRTNLSAYPYLPSVFKPLFFNTGTNVIISGYQEVGDAVQFLRNIPQAVWKDPTSTNDMQAGSFNANTMMYGIPLVIGAKKGFPNFNEFAMQTEVKVTRKLEFRRPLGENQPVNETNQMYTVAISNSFGLEAFNSYLTNFQRPVQIFASVDMSAILTNETSFILLTNQVSTNSGAPRTIAQNSWEGFGDPTHPHNSFITPFNPSTNHFLFLTNSTYSDSRRRFETLTGAFEQHPGNPFLPIPHWWVRLRAKVRFYVVDTAANRLIDYVNLDSKEEPVDISGAMMSDAQCGSLQDPEPDGAFWCTNRFGNAAPNNDSIPSWGVMNQIRVCEGDAKALNGWPVSVSDKAGVDFFRAQFPDMSSIYNSPPFSKTNIFYSPYNPTRTVYLTVSWQANDPLVHYVAGDLQSPRTNLFELNPPKVLDNIGKLNTRYEPWTNNLTKLSTTLYSLNVKDPLVGRSDDWNFPVNKFANVGWLGRVHRGTPWQTVYMKSAGIQTNDWQKWSGNFQMITNYDGKGTTNLDAALSFPISDWKLFDLFTTAPNENATRSQLSVNQTNIAAWSAVLGNVIVATNTFTNANYTIMDPAGAYDVFKPNNYPPLARIVNGIINARTNFVGTNFHHVGEILAAPELTVASPFLDQRKDFATQQPKYVNDQIYEWIPQQIMSLLKGGDLDQPKFVLYCFGQSLKPAEHSLITSGPYQGLCTNYQITAEVITKTVVRIEGAPNNPHAIIESYNVLPAE